LKQNLRCNLYLSQGQLLTDFLYSYLLPTALFNISSLKVVQHNLNKHFNVIETCAPMLAYLIWRHMYLKSTDKKFTTHNLISWPKKCIEVVFAGNCSSCFKVLVKNKTHYHLLTYKAHLHQRLCVFKTWLLCFWCCEFHPLSPCMYINE